MAREPRPDVSGGWHHITSHALRNEQVYLWDSDRNHFLSLLHDATVKYGTEVVAYCLMGNHYHLVLHCPSAGLSRTVQHFTSRYVRCFNRCHGFNGPLFKSRFSSKRIEDDRQLLATTRYVHRNPLDLGFAIETYPWSSYQVYLDGESDGLVVPNLALELAGGADAYRRLVEQALPNDAHLLSDGVRSIAAISQSRSSIGAIEADVYSRAPKLWSQSQCRAVVTLIAAQSGLSTSMLAEHFGFATTASFRARLSRDRRLVASHPALRAFVAEFRQARPDNRAA